MSPVRPNRENPWFEESKNLKNIAKKWFSWKNIFFLMRKIMLILRFPHSFRVWGCWGRSNSIHFVIFRVLGTPNPLIFTRFLSMEIHHFRLKISKLTILERSQHSQTRKLYGKRSITIIFLSMKKLFFYEKYFFAIFLRFPDSCSQWISRFRRSGGVSVLTAMGSDNTLGYPRK